jgi:hypothetical protein
MGAKGKSKYDSVFKSGDRFSKWEVIDGTIYVIGEAKVKCKCECGEEGLVSVLTLTKGTSTKCLKCGNSLKKEDNPAFKGYKDIPYVWFKRYFLNGKRKRTGDVTMEQIYDIWIKQDKKCALSGIPIDWENNNGVTCSLDRIDSKKEYTIGNVQLVHKDVNVMKHHYDESYFIKMCELITNFSKIK